MCLRTRIVIWGSVSTFCFERRDFGNIWSLLGDLDLWLWNVVNGLFRNFTFLSLLCCFVLVAIRDVLFVVVQLIAPFSSLSFTRLEFGLTSHSEGILTNAGFSSDCNYLFLVLLYR